MSGNRNEVNEIVQSNQTPSIVHDCAKRHRHSTVQRAQQAIEITWRPRAIDERGANYHDLQPSLRGKLPK